MDNGEQLGYGRNQWHSNLLFHQLACKPATANISIDVFCISLGIVFMSLGGLCEKVPK